MTTTTMAKQCSFYSLLLSLSFSFCLSARTLVGEQERKMREKQFSSDALEEEYLSTCAKRCEKKRNEGTREAVHPMSTKGTEDTERKKTNDTTRR